MADAGLVVVRVHGGTAATPAAGCRYTRGRGHPTLRPSHHQKSETFPPRTCLSPGLTIAAAATSARPCGLGQWLSPPVARWSHPYCSCLLSSRCFPNGEPRRICRRHGISRLAGWPSPRHGMLHRQTHHSKLPWLTETTSESEWQSGRWAVTGVTREGFPRSRKGACSVLSGVASICSVASLVALFVWLSMLTSVPLEDGSCVSRGSDYLAACQDGRNELDLVDRETNWPSTKRRTPIRIAFCSPHKAMERKTETTATDPRAWGVWSARGDHHPAAGIPQNLACLIAV